MSEFASSPCTPFDGSLRAEPNWCRQLVSERNTVRFEVRTVLQKYRGFRKQRRPRTGRNQSAKSVNVVSQRHLAAKPPRAAKRFLAKAWHRVPGQKSLRGAIGSESRG